MSVAVKTWTNSWCTQFPAAFFFYMITRMSLLKKYCLRFWATPKLGKVSTWLIMPAQTQTSLRCYKVYKENKLQIICFRNYSITSELILFCQERTFLEIFSFNSTRWFILLFPSRTIRNWAPKANSRLYSSVLFKRSAIKIKPMITYVILRPI